MDRPKIESFFHSWVIKLKAPFLYQGKIDFPVLIVFIVINAIVLTNSVLHAPQVGYDEVRHLEYMHILPTRLPTSAENKEFFSPPLSYFLPSLYDKACSAISSHKKTKGDYLLCRNAAGKFGQYLNLLLSLGITFLFLKISDKVRPGNRYFKLSAISMLGLLTVYYKTFSQMRGEPYVAFFVVCVIYLIVSLLLKHDESPLKYGLVLGILLGLLVLSRQWGFFMFPALLILAAIVFLGDKVFRWKFSKIILGSFIIAFLVGSWFYWYLRLNYGSFSAFNIDPLPFSFSNQPLSFYRNTGLGNFLLFKSPIRRAFDNQFLPIFYSDTWGDYWGYFVFVREKLFGAGNESQIGPYLGRVNFVSLFPTFIMFGGMIMGIIRFIQSFRFKGLKSGEDVENQFLGFLFSFIVISMGGFFYFLIKYPLLGQGVTIKATYMIQVFMAVPFLAAEFLEWLRSQSSKLYYASLIINSIVFLHNLPAMITRYIPW